MEKIDKEDVKMSEYIWGILADNFILPMSWGVELESVHTIKMGVQFQVNGFKHKGLVNVIFNEGEDLFEISLLDNDGSVVRSIEHVYVDQLLDTIDNAVEKTDNYEQSIKDAYGVNF